jgi:capsular polysaccharide transport system ATP-binding protein
LIHLIDVSKTYKVGDRHKTVLRPITMSLPTDRHIGVLGRNGAGKSTFLRLLAGAEMPDRGIVRRDDRISWPVGFGTGFHPEMTGRENLAFIARLYGAEPRDIIPFAEDFAELGSYMTMPIRTYSTGMRARLSFAASMAFDFDCYLVDEITAVGDSRFRRKCREAFDARRRRSGIIMVSHYPETIREYCA